MLSADRFARPDVDLPVDPGMRARLVDRFGLFGIRTAVLLVQLGARDSPSLARRTRRAQRARRAASGHRRAVRSACRSAQDPFGAAGARAGAARVRRPRVAGSRAARTGRRPRFRRTPPAGQTAVVVGVAARRGDPGAAACGRRIRDRRHPAPRSRRRRVTCEIRAAAVDAVRHWRSRAEHPLLDPFTVKAASVAARSAEGLVAGVR